MIKRVIYYRKKRSYKALRGLFFLTLFFLIIILSVFAYKKYPLFSKPKVYKIQLTKEIEKEYKSKINNFIKSYPDQKIEYSNANPDIIIDSNKKDGYENLLIKETPSLVFTAGTVKKTLRDKKNYWLIFKDRNKLVNDLENYFKNSNLSENKLSLTAVGDIIPGRTVAQKIAQKGLDYPFAKIAPYVSGADVVYGNLECPLSDKISPPYEGMSFVAPTKTIEGIKMCKFNILSLANNHSTNFGENVFIDTLNLLKANNIKYVGGGGSYEEAYSPTIIEVKDMKIAFLNFNSIIGSLDATPTSPGTAWINMEPWSKDKPEDIKLVQSAVNKAKSEADLVIVCFHWGIEYELNPSSSQRNMAHAACDAGADIIIGTHPHCVQSVEYYQGKFIAYSLGNFVFDQMWSEETREGVIAKYQFQGKQLISIELLPYKIEDYCQPNILNQVQGKPIIDKILSVSNF